MQRTADIRLNIGIECYCYRELVLMKKVVGILLIASMILAILPLSVFPVMACTPKIDLDKTANTNWAYPGDTITYTYAVRNIGQSGSYLTGVHVNDDLLGTPTYVSGDDGDGKLEIGETWIFTAQHVVQEEDPNPLVNYATAYGYYGATVYTATDSVSVTILRLEGGNPTCEDIGCCVSCPDDKSGEYKVDPPTNGIFHTGYYVGSTEIVITISNFDGTYFDWSSNLPIYAVIVKGGKLGANVYCYGTGATSDTGLHAPVNPSGKYADISHMTFCFCGSSGGGETPPISVEKTAVTEFTRTYEWSIVKTATPQSIDMFVNDEATIDYSVEVKQTGFTDSDFKVFGTITITNLIAESVRILEVTDTISGYGAVTVNLPVSLPYDLSPGQTLEGTYTATLPDGSDRTNTATVAIPGDTVSDDAEVAFGAPTTKVNEQITVSDSYKGELGTVTASDETPYSSKTFTYSRTVTYPVAGAYQIENTATIEETGQESSATVGVKVWSLDVSKTAETSFKRTYQWTIYKTGDKTDLGDLHVGDGTATVNYEVVVGLGDPQYIDGGYAVTGTITVTNGAPIPVIITGISDVVSVGINADVKGPAFPYLLAAESFEVWTYSADLPDDIERTNTATVTIANCERPLEYQWDVEGAWVLNFYLPDSGPYPHDAVFTQDANTLTGVGGGYLAGASTYDFAWDLVSGSVIDNDIAYTAEYTYGAMGTTWNVYGTIAGDGTMSGIWNDNYGGYREGTWTSATGKATLIYSSIGVTDFQAQAKVDFTNAEMIEVDKCVDVTDDVYGDLGEVCFGDAPKTFQYAIEWGPYDEIGSYTEVNTATFTTRDTKTTGSDSWEVTVDVYLCLYGYKFYDTNVNGKWDDGELAIPGFRVDLYAEDDTTLLETVYTDNDGKYCFKIFELGTYNITEVQPLGKWVPTTAWTVDITIDDGTQDKEGYDFGNVCLGAGGGKTLGFWSNKNGQATMNDGGTMMPELAMLSGLNLRNAAGGNFDPTTYTQFRTWLLGGTATNMAYMLSVQLAAMELNVEAGFVSNSTFVYAPGTTGANAAGFITIKALMEEANDELGLHGDTTAGSPFRHYQECLKNALDNANNNLNFVCPGPCLPIIYP